MLWRARLIARLLAPHLPVGGAVLDLGCGTGHNAEALCRLGSWAITEADVTDMKRVGPPPVLFDGRTLPFDDGAFDTVLLIHMLHYVPQPQELFAELRRVSRRTVLVYQTVHHRSWGRPWLGIQEFCMGRGALRCARMTQYTPRAKDTALDPATLFDRPKLKSMLGELGAIFELGSVPNWSWAPMCNILIRVELA